MSAQYICKEAIKMDICDETGALTDDFIELKRGEVLTEELLDEIPPFIYRRFVREDGSRIEICAELVEDCFERIENEKKPLPCPFCGEDLRTSGQ